MELHEQLKQWFTSRGYTIRVVAEALGYGYSQTEGVLNGRERLNDRFKWRVIETYPETALFLLPGAVVRSVVSHYAPGG